MLHTTVGLLCDTSNEINIFSKLDRERCVCFVACWSRGGCLTHEEGEGRGQQGRGCRAGGGALLEGSTERSTLERLGRTVVVHHAALCLTLCREEQAAEFGHLWKWRRWSRQSPSCWTPVTVTQQIHHYSLATESPTFKLEYCSRGIQQRSSIVWA